MNKALSYTINWQVSLGGTTALWLYGEFSAGGCMELSSVMFCMCYSSGQRSQCSLWLIFYHSKIHACCNWYSPRSVCLCYIVLTVCLVFRFFVMSSCVVYGTGLGQLSCSVSVLLQRLFAVSCTCLSCHGWLFISWSKFLFAKQIMFSLLND